jgi:hypothetical protein
MFNHRAQIYYFSWKKSNRVVTSGFLKLAHFLAARDIPFHIGCDEKTMEWPKKPFGYSADLRGLRLLQVNIF